jgi:PAS domain S-box-containing protein
MSDRAGAHSQTLSDDLEAVRGGLIVRAADIGVWDWDLVSDKIVYSPRAKAICGFDPHAEVTIGQVRTLTHPDDRAATADLTRRALDPKAREKGSYEYRIMRPDGELRWVVAHGEAEFAIVDGAERAVRYIGTLQDVTEQRRLAQAEQQASERLRLAVEAGRMAVWDFNVASGVLSTSPELNRLMGFADDAEPTRADYEAGYLPGEGDRVRAEFQSVIAAGGASVETEFQHQGPDGVQRWLMLRAEVAKDAAGRPERVFGVLLDVTERRRGEQALRESEARFRIMADSAPSPVWVTTAAGGIEFVNEAFTQVAGRPRDSLAGDVWLDLLHPDDIAQVSAARAAAREKLAPYSFEARFRNADGRYRWMLASSKPRFDAAGVFQGYVGMAVDLTERRLAQEALKESEQRFRQMAEGAPAMLWVGDETGKCVYLNKALRDFWGVAEDLSDFTWSATLVPEDRESLFEAFGAAMAKQEGFEVEARYYRADGAVRTLKTQASPRRDAAGRFLGMHGVNIDVTDIREAEAKQRLLINELNHRVKNTLASVQSMARQSLRPGTSVDVGRERLVERVMALSRAHDVLTQSDWKHAEMGAIVADALDPFIDPAAQRFLVGGPDCRLGPNAALSVAMALHELATNAEKYGALSTPGGRVELAWTCENGRARLTWREMGGPPVVEPTRKGFGTRLLQAGVAAEPSGGTSLEFAPSGVIAVLTVRMAD